MAEDRRLARLFASAHRRLESTSGRLEGAAATILDPTGDERLAVDRLLGSRSRGVGLRVPLVRLEAVLQERAGSSLVSMVEAVVGPLRDRPGERAARVEEEKAMWGAALVHPALARHRDLIGWLERQQASGKWRADPDFGAHLDAALSVLERLPSPVPIGRSRLAASVLGSSHALDGIEAVGRLVPAALAYLAGTGLPATSLQRRRLWAGMGVDDDETSSTVLVLGLRPACSGPMTEAVARWADGGVPMPIPLAALQREPWRFPGGELVHACENPSVLHAAGSRLGARCPPMVCLEGNPSVAAVRLIEVLVGERCAVAYHGDFGSGGIAIGNRVIGAMGAQPWRFRVEDYRAGVAHARATGVQCLPLRGRLPEACWDAELASAMARAGVEIEEELVLEDLLADLR
ncbi:MAG TPA: TIGR02679 family protein [Actinomycetota bacterium]|nr:TIGR02679 family protein [Actinomycetota bacterium]